MYNVERRMLLLIAIIWLTFLSTVFLGLRQSVVQEGEAPPRTWERGKTQRKQTDPRPIWWHAPFISGGGYSTEAVEFVVGLYRGRYVAPGRLWVSQHGDLPSEEVLRGMEPGTRQDVKHLLSETYERTFLYGETALDAIIICHSVPSAWALPLPLFETSRCPPIPVEQAAFVIGRTMFEADSLPPDHVERCNKMHEIWLPTEFHRELYRRNGVTQPQLVVVPEPVDTQAFDPARHDPLPLPIGVRVFGRRQAPFPVGPGPHIEKQQVLQRPFVFLSIFKWEERKAWDVLLGAYLREFSADDPVLLLLLTKPFYSGSNFPLKMRAWAAAQHLPALETAGGGGAGASSVEELDWQALPRVYVQGEHLPQPSLPRLYKAADAFVLPSRGEGWGRPHVEAMAMGLPVIATNWSGPAAFLDESVGYPLRIDGLVAAPQDQGPFAGRLWAQPSVAHLRQLMRRVVERPGEAAARGAAARRRMVERYAPDVVARLVAARLGEIDALLKRQQGHRHRQQGWQQT